LLANLVMVFWMLADYLSWQRRTLDVDKY